MGSPVVEPVALVAEIVVDAAGYKFQPLAGFAVSIQDNAAKLTGTAPDLSVAPSIVMNAGQLPSRHVRS